MLAAPHDRDFAQMFATAWPGDTFAIAQAKTGAVRRANQNPLIKQEFPRNVVQATTGMRADIAPGGEIFTIAINDDGLIFTVDDPIYGAQSRQREVRPGN